MPSQAVHNCRRIVGTSECVEEASVRFQNLLGCGPTQGAKFRGHNPAFCSVTGLKRFGHGAKVFSKSARLTSNQTKSIQYFRTLKPKQLCAGRCGTKRSACSRGMKSILIMAR